MDFSNFLSKNYNELIKDSSFKKYSSLSKEKIDTDFFLGGKKDGIVFSFSKENLLYQIDFYSEGYEGYSEFKGQLPNHMSFDLSKEQLNDLLGKPTVHQKSRKIPIIGVIPPVDSYIFQGYRMVLHYSESLDRIQMLTLTTK